MKHLLWISAVVAGIGGAVWYFFIRKKPTTTNPAANNTNTATAPTTYLTLWSGVTQNALTAAKSTQTGILGLFSQVSNAFGSNDGGQAPAAISGSNNGGTQSSGSGAGVPQTSTSVIPGSLFDLNFPTSGAINWG